MLSPHLPAVFGNISSNYTRQVKHSFFYSTGPLQRLLFELQA